MPSLKHKNSGQSLIEVMIALLLVSLVALGLVKATTAGLQGTSFSKDQSKAVSLAQKRISEIIEMKNQDQNFFSNLPVFADNISDETKFCFRTTVTEALGELPPETPDFPNAKAAKINVDVFWDETGVGNQCDSKDYKHTQHFETYVTQ